MREELQVARQSFLWRHLPKRGGPEIGRKRLITTEADLRAILAKLPAADEEWRLCERLRLASNRVPRGLRRATCKLAASALRARWRDEYNRSNIAQLMNVLIPEGEEVIDVANNKPTKTFPNKGKGSPKAPTGGVTNETGGNISGTRAKGKGK